MAVDYDLFRKWAESRFDDVVIKGREIRLNSIFSPGDSGHHLWCSPSGGKKNVDLGVYRCFKTDASGTLAKLVMTVDGIGFVDAVKTLRGEASFQFLDEDLEELWEYDENDENALSWAKPTLTMPEGSYLISSLAESDWWRQRAEEYLSKRNIPIDGLWVGKEPPYKARIIIPYYDRLGNLIYFNGRHFGNSKLRYLGPPKECGVGKSDVVYMPGGRWPAKDSEVFVCEGEFNAMSLRLCGLNAAACGGKNMDEKQALSFSDYRIVLCLDRDKAGWKGTEGMSNTVSMFLAANHSLKRLHFVRPPQGEGDWNDMFVKYGPEFTKVYLQRAKRELDPYAPANMVGDYFTYFDL